jgi:hypothetical protein
MGLAGDGVRDIFEVVGAIVQPEGGACDVVPGDASPMDCKEESIIMALELLAGWACLGRCWAGNAHPGADLDFDIFEAELRWVFILCDEAAALECHLVFVIICSRLCVGLGNRFVAMHSRAMPAIIALDNLVQLDSIPIDIRSDL